MCTAGKRALAKPFDGTVFLESIAAAIGSVVREVFAGVTR